MNDLISRQAAIDAVYRYINQFDAIDANFLDGLKDAIIIVKALPSAQPEPESFEQLKWERDLAIRQLADLGYGLGEKPRTNDDLISRRAAIDALCDNCDNVQAVCAHYPCKQYIAIEKLLSAQPEHKAGKWVDGWLSRLDGTRHWFRECSECGYERDDDNPEKDTNYCPNCGAEMKGEQE